LLTSNTIHILIGAALLLPPLSFVLCYAIPQRFSWSAPIIASLLLLVSATCSVYLSFNLPVDSAFLISINWFQVGTSSFTANLELNPLSILMLPVVTVISLLVHLYSIGYMVSDSGIRRYFAMLGFFTFAMLGIVLANDLLLIFVFWELVGFSSYLLIGHWINKPEAAKAAQKAFLFNRIGDVGFIIALMIIWANTKTFNLNDLLYHFDFYSWQTAASLGLLCGVIGKSAQLPLFTWLPDAMEGPTPVSALIHAATMVAAGVLLLAKVFLLFTPVALQVVIVIGSVTALLAGYSALNQYDIKKILAYSTISQLGLMLIAVGAGSKNAAMLHLFTHAFFKAGLFLAAGSVIYAMHQAHSNFDVQDIRNLGGLRKKLPFTFIVFVITGAALSGLPFFTGFISKDAIITAIWSSMPVLIIVLTISFLTLLYTFRLIWYVFMGDEKNDHAVAEPPLIMRIPLGVLAIASIGLTISLNPFSTPAWFNTLLGKTPVSNAATILSTITIAVALITAWFLYAKNSVIKPVSTFAQNNFGLDAAYEKFIGKAFIKISSITEATDRKWIDGALHATAYTQVAFSHIIAWFDKVFIDGFVNGMATFSSGIGSFTRSFQGGKIQRYIFWALVGLIIFIIYIMFQ
jgi:NADH-quinone oxidoreductase subunit L